MVPALRWEAWEKSTSTLSKADSEAYSTRFSAGKSSLRGVQPKRNHVGTMKSGKVSHVVIKLGEIELRVCSRSFHASSKAFACIAGSTTSTFSAHSVLQPAADGRLPGRWRRRHRPVMRDQPLLRSKRNGHRSSPQKPPPLSQMVARQAACGQDRRLFPHSAASSGIFLGGEIIPGNWLIAVLLRRRQAIGD